MMKLTALLLTLLLFINCNKEDEPITSNDNCISDQVIDKTRGVCDEKLAFSSLYTETISGSKRIFNSNSIPLHDVGLFGRIKNALNPNAISEQSEMYTISLDPIMANDFIALLNDGPAYSFGLLLNGVELDPVAAEPFPHKERTDPNVNWEWNLEALNVNLGLDCNNAHVQPNGKYHYHGTPTQYIDNNNISSNKMTQIGWAADGFPIYYQYAYSISNDNTSSIVKMESSYKLKTGIRPGDGESAPCGEYDGSYSNDYEFIQGLGTLDEANGRIGVTQEFPQGIYYYIITDDFPGIPRYFRGAPSESFKIGR